MYWFSKKFSRRDILKGVVAFGGAMAMYPWLDVKAQSTTFSDSGKLGRVCSGLVNIRSKPSIKC